MCNLCTLSKEEKNKVIIQKIQTINELTAIACFNNQNKNPETTNEKKLNEWYR